MAPVSQLGLCPHMCMSPQFPSCMGQGGHVALLSKGRSLAFTFASNTRVVVALGGELLLCHTLSQSYLLLLSEFGLLF